MRPRRLLAAALVAACLPLAVPAAAAPPVPLCALGVDPVGDARYRYLGPEFADAPALDLVGFDLAFGPRDVTARVRLVQTAPAADDQFARTGLRWFYAFKIGGVSYSFDRRTTSTGETENTFAVNSVARAVPEMKVVQDGASITWTVPRKAIDKLSKPRQVVEFVNTVTYWMSTNIDNASTGKDFSYADGQKGCRLLCPFAPGVSGDAAYLPGTTASSLDVLGVDIASGAKSVVAKLALTSTAFTTNADTPAGPVPNETYTRERVRWTVSFTVGGAVYTLRRTRLGARSGGTPGAYADEFLVGDKAASAKAQVAVGKDSITWTVPRAALPSLKPRAAFSAVRATTTWTENDRVVDSVVSAPAATYVDRAPSCVRAS